MGWGGKKRTTVLSKHKRGKDPTNLKKEKGGAGGRVLEKKKKKKNFQ